MRTDGQTVRCFSCKEQQMIPIRCPACGGSSLRERGYGNKRIQEELQTFFPGMTCQLLDRESREMLDDISLIITTSIFFEKTIYELLSSKLILPVGFTDIGTQWGKIEGAPKGRNQYEIDIVALNEKKKQILFGECKWQEHISAERVIKELFDKAKSVLWYNKEREEFYVLFAKSFSKRIEEFEGRKVFCFDLGDIKKILKI